MRATNVLCLLALATFIVCANGERSLSSVTTNQQNQWVSIPFDAARGKGSAPISLDDSRIVATGGPEQVHLTYVNASSVVVSWVTGNGTITNSSVSLGTVNNPYGKYSTVNISSDSGSNYPVKYGTSASSLAYSATGNVTTYAQIYTGFVNDTGFANNNPIANYTSGLIHHVQLTGLMSSMTYYYAVTDGNTTSRTFNFTTAPAVGSFPMKMGVYADVGQTYNSSVTLQRLLDAGSSVLAFIGDWSYADDYTTSGQCLVIGFPNNTFTGNNISSPSGSWQPRWDTFFRLAQPLLSHIPIIPNSGNHELEPQGNGRYFISSGWGLDDGRQFNSYLARVPTGQLSSASGGAPLYFSTNVGPVHYVTLSNYENFLVGSPQFNWVAQDLAAVDRTKTPWLIVSWHAPWYSTYTTHYKETESMRVSMEGMFHAAGVDIVLGGHLHEYERSHALFNYRRSDCGTVYINIGDGGNVEGLYTTFIDQPGTGNCPAPGPKSLPNYQPGPWTPSFTYNLQNAYNGYCPTPSEGEPDWSAFRQPSFGQGLLNFINETHARWQWNRDIDDSETNYPDDVYIIRDRSCYNYVANAAAYSPYLAPQVASYVNSSIYNVSYVPTTGPVSAAASTPPLSANGPVGGQYVAASG